MSQPYVIVGSYGSKFGSQYSFIILALGPAARY